MQLEVHGKEKLIVTPALKSYVKKACEKFKKMRFVQELDVVHVELRVYRDHLAKVTFTYTAKSVGKTFVASAEGKDMYVAINAARDKILSQQKKLKAEMS